MRAKKGHGMVKHNKSTLTARIRQVFATQEYPGDENLVCDHSSDDLELVELATVFRGKHWADIPPQLLEYHCSVLSFFTAQAFRYYLPAFMLGYINHYEILDNVSFFLISHLTCPDRSDWEVTQGWSEKTIESMPEQIKDMMRKIKRDLRDLLEEQGGIETVDTQQRVWFMKRVEGFSREEKAVIREFLEYARDNGDMDASRALESYWESV